MEDFRSVIDDLTIQNKKLKRRLKRFEKLHDAHLQDEKLFEVRVHGLAPNKKRELEETLRQFAFGLDASPASDSSLPILDRFAPALNSHKTTSSSRTSYPQIADSAYVSMSASAPGSSVPGHTSTGANGHDRPSKMTSKSAKTRDDNIESYLHDIAEGLLPRRPSVMTERAKGKLVVRRLEQIFAGKGAAVEGHQQPLQQQEVSQMAAKADRTEIEARGQQAAVEGLREARIMSEDGQSHLHHAHKVESNPQKSRRVSIDGASLEQRPTRPLDLDPYRAQVPMENISYIRHLGFSPTDVQTTFIPEDGHGWIYLNLLINMAQLHTLNVTGDFVKKALMDLSSKFELSNDGRKVRWRGGPGISRTSSNGSSSADADQEAYFRSRQENRRSKRTKTKKLDNPPTVQAGSDSQQRSINKGASNNRVLYTPLFYHRENSEEDVESSCEDSGLEDSPQPAYLTGISSGLASSGRRTSSSRKKRDDGPIIFYNKARFCTDLSGDRGATKDKFPNMINYQSVTSDVIGSDDNEKRNRQSMESSKGPLSRATQLPEPMDLDDNPIPVEQELNFPHESLANFSRSQTCKSSPPQMEFEVSGLGGVCPDDNFEITVNNRHWTKDENKYPQAAHGFDRKIHHHRLAAVLGSSKRNASPAIEEQIIDMERRNLPPSALPPPSYFPTESSPETDESDEDSDVSQLPDSPNHEIPATAPQPLAIPAAHSDEDSWEESDTEGYDANESDSSVDLLAAAREIDPAMVAAQEREYDSNIAERLAEEIPAGSSAATAGGGSGFATPAHRVADADENSDDEHEMEVSKLDSSRFYRGSGPAGMKRSRTGDSMVVHGKTPKLDENSFARETR